MRQCVIAALLLVTTIPAFAWEYASTPDKMGRGDTRTAVTSSENQVSLKPPYAGAQRARLLVIDRGGKRTDVIFALEKGQILCHSYSCDVSVRFDDQPSRAWGANKPSDGSSNLIFLDMEPIFVVQAIRAKKVLIEVTLYQNGNQVFEFPVGPLEGKWIGGSEQVKKRN